MCNSCGINEWTVRVSSLPVTHRDGFPLRIQTYMKISSAVVSNPQGRVLTVGSTRITHRRHSLGFLPFRCPPVLAVVTSRCGSHVAPIKKNCGSDDEPKWTEKSRKARQDSPRPVRDYRMCRLTEVAVNHMGLEGQPIREGEAIDLLKAIQSTQPM